jgi:hypothetical protein
MSWQAGKPKEDGSQLCTNVVTRTERIGGRSQNAPKIHCLMLFSGQKHFALEPFPRDSQARPAIDLLGDYVDAAQAALGPSLANSDRL